MFSGIQRVVRRKQQPAAHPGGGQLIRAASLKRVPESAAGARTLVADALTDWGLEGLVDDAELVVTELVSNAIAHACGDTMRVSVELVTERQVRIAVIDCSRTRPQLRLRGSEEDREEEHGRGLLLVQMCSREWDVTVLPGGKRVSALLEAS